jgi:predicted kinase
VLRSDVERKALAGCGENERLPAEAYTAESAARVYAMLTEKARRIITAGHSAIVDAVFARSEERDALRDVARRSSIAFHGLFLTADLATRVARVGSRRADASDADEAVAQAQEQYLLGPIDWSSIDASGAPEQSLESARKFVT